MPGGPVRPRILPGTGGRPGRRGGRIVRHLITQADEAEALAPPQIPIFPAGYGPLPADFNTWVEESLEFITTQIVLRVHQTSAQNYTSGVTSGSGTIVAYNVVDEDPYNGWDAANLRWMVPFSGWYEVTVYNSIQTTNCVLRSSILVSGGNAILSQQYSPCTHQIPASFLGGGVATAIVGVTGDLDYIQGQCMIPSGANGNNDVTARGRYPSMEISFLSQ